MILLALRALVVLAFTLSFTLPAFESSDTCRDPSEVPEDHIAYVTAYDADTGQQLAILDTWRKAPGDTVQWWVEVFGVRRVYITATDEGSNETCPSDTITVDGGAPPVVGVGDLDPIPFTLPQSQWFDVTGRKLDRSPFATGSPGVFFERLPNGTVVKWRVVRR